MPSYCPRVALRRQPPFAPFVPPIQPLDGSLQTATLAHGHPLGLGWGARPSRFPFSASRQKPFPKRNGSANDSGARPVVATGHPPPVPHRCLMLVTAGTKRAVCAPAFLRRKRRWVRSPLAEKSTPLPSHHLVRRSDETWLTEWSGGLGERSGARSRSRGCFGASQSSGHHHKKFSGPEVWLGGGWILTRRASRQAESRLGRRGMETAKFGRD